MHVREVLRREELTRVQEGGKRLGEVDKALMKEIKLEEAQRHLDDR